jgi:uncharacterized protein
LEIIIIGIAAFIASLLTLYSGFGLGTILMPVFALFFPVDIAVALTAIVHLLNNFFKLVLLGKHADWKVVLKFGITAIIFAVIGALLLNAISFNDPLASYALFGREYTIYPVKFAMGIIILTFAIVENLPSFKNMAFPPKYLPLGGAISGFFGGLSGHQGAFRSAFLIKSGLSKEAFIATGVVIACLIDVSRLAVYSTHFSRDIITENPALLITAILAAFAGAYFGNKLIKKVTLKFVQLNVSILLAVIGILLIMGII